MRCRQCNFESADTEEFCPSCGASRSQNQNSKDFDKSTALPVGTVLVNKYRIESNHPNVTRNLYEATCLATGRKVLLEEAMLCEEVDCVERNRGAKSSPKMVSIETEPAREVEQSIQNQMPADNDYIPMVSLKERFELLSSLGCPKSPRVYEYFTVGSREYLVLEPPLGRNLVSLAAENAITEELALDIAVELCRCIDEIHRHGYLHLNIEPGNIYIFLGEVSLFDFSRAIRQGSVSPSYLTSDGFSAPELMLPDRTPADTRADIYSIGAVLFWMLFGEKVTLAGVFPYKVLSLVSSPELARILVSCLATDVNYRYKTVKDLEERLLAYQASKKMNLHYESASLTDIGMVRSNNEDSCFLLECCQASNSRTNTYGIYLVADGMGGHAAGELASAKAVETISLSILNAMSSANQHSSFTELVKCAMEKANTEIHSMALGNPHLSLMGTTVTIGLRVNNELYLGHVGDSRCCLVREGKIKQLTRDHSVVGGLLERGMITPEQAKLHPDRGKIYRCLGSVADVLIDTCETTGYGEKLILQSGDILLFCTDGLTSVVSDEYILECIEKGDNSYDICRELVRLANMKGGDDNISVIVVKVITGIK